MSKQQVPSFGAPQFSAEGNAKVETREPAQTQPNVASPFNPEQPRKSVFEPPVKVKASEAPEPFPLGERDPSWIELVTFVQKHGDAIIQARYPQPRGECIDTIYRGVTVIAHETTQVRHVKHGWIDWADAIY